ncbi:MAG TPA: hypothetical protein VHV51_20895 [Polyangiaceae bacterium]|nr:hypothetical protein [Polyangiaceae bacterium]
MLTDPAAPLLDMPAPETALPALPPCGEAEEPFCDEPHPKPKENDK